MDFFPKIYGFGSACVDYRIHIPDMGDGHTAKVLADDVLEIGGGACANCLVQTARLTGDCTYLGKLGHDPQAETIKSLFFSENIKIELIESEQGTLSPFNIAVYKGSSNERVGGYLLPNSLKSITCDEAVELAGRIDCGSGVIVEIGEIPLESVLAFLKAALNKNTRIFIDVDLDPIKQLKVPFELFEEVMGLADIIIPNYETVSDIYGIEDKAYLTAHMAARLGKTIVMTAGGKGAYYCEKEEGVRHMPVKEIKEPADTVGAGDSFHGAFVYSMGLGFSLERSIASAMECARLTCMGFGARTSMPILADVKHILL